jgi:hypothetical protein
MADFWKKTFTKKVPKSAPVGPVYFCPVRNLTDHLRTVFVRASILFGLLFLTQLWFISVNRHRFDLSDWGLWMGMAVFLLAAVSFLMIPAAVLELLPVPFRRRKCYRKTTSALYLATLAISTGANLADAHFFSYTLKRSTADVFDMMGRDTGMFGLIPAFLRDYWLTVVFWILLIWLGFKADRSFRPRFNALDRFNLGYVIRHLGILAFASALIVIGSRGGLRLKPLAPISAHNYSHPGNVAAVLNTPFTIIRTWSSGGFSAGELMDLETARIHFDFITDLEPFERDFKPNFVLLILESFGNEVAGRMTPDSSTPFLDSLLRHSLVAPVGLANGQRSIDALPAMISGIPCLMNAPFISSVYGGIKTESSVRMLRNEGYSTAFFHGGTNGTMGFDDFAESVGFEKYIGLNEYPHSGHHDGAWGIYDEEFLEFSSEKISTMKEPFFSAVFTLSSHHPYGVPPHRSHLFSGSDLEKSVRYADYSLRNFFRLAKKTEWFQHTIFILTADHSPSSTHEFYRNPIGRFLVPIAFYSADSSLLPTQINPMVQHSDLPAAVLKLSGMEGRIFTAGSDPFSPDKSKLAFGFVDEVYQWADEEWLYRFDGIRSIGLYRWREDSLLLNNLIEQRSDHVKWLENHMKAALTIFGHALKNNQMTAE